MTNEARLTLPPEYSLFLEELKERIRSAQVRAAVSVNRELVFLYWQIGQRILAAQQAQGWGARVIERLSQDLRAEFPSMKGFSPATSSTCAPLPRPGRKSQLCNRLLHKSHGGITSACWTG